MKANTDQLLSSIYNMLGDLIDGLGKDSTTQSVADKLGRIQRLAGNGIAKAESFMKAAPKPIYVEFDISRYFPAEFKENVKKVVEEPLIKEEVKAEEKPNLEVELKAEIKPKKPRKPRGKK